MRIRVPLSARRLRTLVVREVRTTLRDRFTATILVAVPILALLLFSSILSTEVKHLGLGVHDASGTVESRALVHELGAQDAFDVTPFATRDDLARAIRRGRLGLAIVIPPDFGRQREDGTAGEVQVIYDGADSVLAANAEGSLLATIAALAPSLAGQPPPGVGAGGVSIDARALFNPTLDGTAFMVAGVFGWVLSFLTVLITAVSIVGERSAGTFDQLQVTPATSLEILLGKLLPLGAVFAFDVLLMALVAGVALGVWPRGSLVFFLGVSSVYVMISLAIGLIISATSATASEAVQRSVLFSIPLVMLSGFAFPIRSMPRFVQWVAEAFPATHYIRVSRAIYMRASGPADFWGDLVFIGLSGAILFALAVRSLGSRA